MIHVRARDRQRPGCTRSTSTAGWEAARDRGRGPGACGLSRLPRDPGLTPQSLGPRRRHRLTPGPRHRPRPKRSLDWHSSRSNACPVFTTPRDYPRSLRGARQEGDLLDALAVFKVHSPTRPETKTTFRDPRRPCGLRVTVVDGDHAGRGRAARFFAAGNLARPDRRGPRPGPEGTGPDPRRARAATARTRYRIEWATSEEDIARAEAALAGTARSGRPRRRTRRPEEPEPPAATVSRASAVAPTARGAASPSARSPTTRSPSEARHSSPSRVGVAGCDSRPGAWQTEPMTVAMRWAERGFPRVSLWPIAWDEAKSGTSKHPLTPHGHLDGSSRSGGRA